MGYILILNAVLRISWRKNKKFFPVEPLYAMHEVFIDVSLFQETCSAPKNIWWRTCNFQLNSSS